MNRRRKRWSWVCDCLGGGVWSHWGEASLKARGGRFVAGIDEAGMGVRGDGCVEECRVKIFDRCVIKGITSFRLVNQK